MSDPIHAAALFKLAEADFVACRAMIDTPEPSPFSDEIIGFHAQQAVEKALKTWTAALGYPYRRTHDLMRLLTDLTSFGEDVSAYVELVDLDPFAVQFRYVMPSAEERKLERRMLIREVGGLLARVRGILTPSADPPAADAPAAPASEE